MRLTISILSILVLFGMGCSASTGSSVQLPSADSFIDDSLERPYVNGNLGYRFDQPVGHNTYSRVAGAANKLKPATFSDSNVLLFEEGVENGLPGNELIIQHFEGERSAHEWLSKHLFEFIPQTDAVLRPGKFADKDALFVRGAGTFDSYYRVVAVTLDSGILLITQPVRYEPFEQVIDTFEFITF